jgi:DNA-directed RNA polymerase omega subunit
VLIRTRDLEAGERRHIWNSTNKRAEDRKQIMSTVNEDIEKAVEESQAPELDSKYRLIIVAAKRSKQLQRGAKPRIDIDPLKHKSTRIALEEVIRGKVPFHIRNDDKK